MNNILEAIVVQKKKEIEKAKRELAIAGVDIFKKHIERKCYSLKRALLEENSTGIIGEFKRKSPSKGWFQSPGLSAPSIVCSYEKAGAAAASVLTDKEYFGGTLNDLLDVREHTDLPLLRKDFIIDEIQVQQAKGCGADMILLIAAILTPKQVEALAANAKKNGMEVLLEIHDEYELNHLCDEIDVVGVNNRNLKTFQTSLDTSTALIKKIPSSFTVVSESGITSAAEIRMLRNEGFKGFLIGENFMKASDPAKSFADLISTLNQKP